MASQSGSSKDGHGMGSESEAASLEKMAGESEEEEEETADEEEDDSSSEEEEVGIALQLPKRTTRGQAYQRLMGDALSEDQAFWSHTTWADEEEDADYRCSEGEELYEDVVDSDFDRAEDETSRSSSEEFEDTILRKSKAKRAGKVATAAAAAAAARRRRDRDCKLHAITEPKTTARSGHSARYSVNDGLNAEIKQKESENASSGRIWTRTTGRKVDQATQEMKRQYWHQNTANVAIVSNSTYPEASHCSESLTVASNVARGRGLRLISRRQKHTAGETAVADEESSASRNRHHVLRPRRRATQQLLLGDHKEDHQMKKMRSGRQDNTDTDISKARRSRRMQQKRKRGDGSNQFRDVARDELTLEENLAEARRTEERNLATLLALEERDKARRLRHVVGLKKSVYVGHLDRYFSWASWLVIGDAAESASQSEVTPSAEDSVKGGAGGYVASDSMQAVTIESLGRENAASAKVEDIGASAAARSRQRNSNFLSQADTESFCYTQSKLADDRKSFSNPASLPAQTHAAATAPSGAVAGVDDANEKKAGPRSPSTGMVSSTETAADIRNNSDNCAQFHREASLDKNKRGPPESVCATVEAADSEDIGGGAHAGLMSGGGKRQTGNDDAAAMVTSSDFAMELRMFTEGKFPDMYLQKPCAPATPARCPVTGLPAKYFDPITGVPYATTRAFKYLREAYHRVREKFLYQLMLHTKELLTATGKKVSNPPCEKSEPDMILSSLDQTLKTEGTECYDKLHEK